MCVLQRYYIPLTLPTFVNYYMRLNSLKLSNQALWLSDRTVTPMLATRAVSFRNKFQNLLKKEKNFLGNYKSSTYVCVYQGGCILITKIFGFCNCKFV
jgi:hypothetical protein